MNVRWLAIVALAMLMASGCGPARRRNDVYQEMLDAEKRFLEDQLYDLHYENGILQDKLESTQRENATLRQTLQERKSDKPGTGGSRDDRISPPSDLDGITPPEIDLGEPTPLTPEGPAITPPDSLLPERSDEAPSAEPEVAPPAGEFPISHEDLADPRITHIHLNPLLTGGSDFDEKSGDEGISVVIEPRNAANQYVPVAGPISLVVLDPAKQGEAARVARWDFTVQETRDTMTRTSFGKGIHLRMPWPQEPPDNSKLQLFVRYTTPEGEKLEAQREIFIERPGHASQRWTPLAPVEGGAEEVAPPEPQLEINPGAAIPRSAPSRVAAEYLSPPPGPTVSERPDRPAWRPYR